MKWFHSPIFKGQKISKGTEAGYQEFLGKISFDL